VFAADPGPYPTPGVVVDLGEHRLGPVTEVVRSHPCKDRFNLTCRCRRSARDRCGGRYGRGEPVAVKVARRVRRAATGNGPEAISLPRSLPEAAVSMCRYPVASAAWTAVVVSSDGLEDTEPEGQHGDAVVQARRSGVTPRRSGSSNALIRRRIRVLGIHTVRGGGSSCSTEVSFSRLVQGIRLSRSRRRSPT
jgi:hypothetical protein